MQRLVCGRGVTGQCCEPFDQWHVWNYSQLVQIMDSNRKPSTSIGELGGGSVSCHRDEQGHVARRVCGRCLIQIRKGV